MARDSVTLTPGEWFEEIKAPHRRLQVLAVHSKPGQPAANVEMAVGGNRVDRLSLSVFAINDASRFRRMRQGEVP